MRCPYHPGEPVRLFGDVGRCAACGEIVATRRQVLAEAEAVNAATFLASGGRYRHLRVVASDSPTTLRPALSVPPSSPARRWLASHLLQLAARLAPEVCTGGTP